MTQPTTKKKFGGVLSAMRALRKIQKSLAVQPKDAERPDPVDAKSLSKKLRTVNEMRDEGTKDEMDSVRSSIAKALVSLTLGPALSAPGTAETLFAAARFTETNAETDPESSHVPLRTALSSRRYAAGTPQDSIWVAYYFPAIGDALTEIGNIGFVVADMRSPGLPLIAVNLGFVRLTRYRQSRALGRNCRFLQTSPQGFHSNFGLVDELSGAIRGHREILTKLVNFDATGAPFQCLVILVPMFRGNRDTKKDDCLYMVGMQLAIDDDFGTNLSTLDTLLRHLPRTTTCVDVERRTREGAAAHLLDPSIPLHIACFLALDPAKVPPKKKKKKNTAADPPEDATPPADDASSQTTPVPRTSSSQRWIAVIEAVLASPTAKRAILELCRTSPYCSIIGRRLLKFVTEVDSVMEIPNKKSQQADLKRLLARPHNNVLYYFSSLEIPRGKLDSTNLDKCLTVLQRWRRDLLPYLARMVVPAMLRECAKTATFLPVQAVITRDTSFSEEEDVEEEDLLERDDEEDDDDDEPDDEPGIQKAACGLLRTLNSGISVDVGRVWRMWMASAPIPLALVKLQLENDIATEILCSNTEYSKLRTHWPDALPKAVVDAIKRNESLWVVRRAIPKDPRRVVWIVQPIRELPGHCAVAVAGRRPQRLLDDVDLVARLVALWSRNGTTRSSRTSFANSRGSISSTVATADTDAALSTLLGCRPSTIEPTVIVDDEPPPEEETLRSPLYDDATCRELQRFGIQIPSPCTQKQQPQQIHKPPTPSRRPPTNRRDRRLCRLINKMHQDHQYYGSLNL